MRAKAVRVEVRKERDCESRDLDELERAQIRALAETGAEVPVL